MFSEEEKRPSSSSIDVELNENKKMRKLTREEKNELFLPTTICVQIVFHHTTDNEHDAHDHNGNERLNCF